MPARFALWAVVLAFGYAASSARLWTPGPPLLALLVDAVPYVRILSLGAGVTAISVIVSAWDGILLQSVRTEFSRH